MKLIGKLGQYYLFVMKVFSKPEKFKIYFRQFVKELELIGFNSIGIVAIISAFMGGVITMQTAYNIENPFLPSYLIGLGTRDSMILEFSSTIVALILAGKVGSNIASEIGTMRVTEQIDALEIMGVNSASYLVLPKIVAALMFFPFLTVLSMFIGISGGWLVGVSTGVTSSEEFLYGVQYTFIPYYVVYSLIKSVFFAFLITSISAFFGYHAEGGALEVGRSSTMAVVTSSIFVLLFNLILTQVLLS